MGFLAGLLGIGGGGIMVPILYELFSAIGVGEAVLNPKGGLGHLEWILPKRQDEFTMRLWADGRLALLRSRVGRDKDEVLAETMIAGEQIDSSSPRRWLLIAREMGVPDEEGGSDRWSLDHLFLPVRERIASLAIPQRRW